jgi:alkylated DNA nucleotide flippase Atl1
MHTRRENWLCGASVGVVAGEVSASRLVKLRILASTHEKVLWHRVVRADGSAPLGADQLALLRKERVPMHGDRVDLARATTLDLPR